MNKSNLKEEIGFWSAIGLVFIFIFFIWSGDLIRQEISPEFTAAATSSAVNVTASVATTISCSVSSTTTDFGTLTSGAVSTSSNNVSSTMGCANDGLGCTLSLNDNGSSTTGGGLYASSTNSLIKSPNATFTATSTLVAGTEGYGIQAATTTAGSGAPLFVAARYFQAGNIYGGLTTSTLTLASSSATSTGREIIVTHGAAISATTKGGTYTDTITYSCTAN